MIRRAGGRHVRDMSEPLIISQDTALLSQVQSSAAAAGLSVAVGGDAAEVRRAWIAAPLVLVGVDRAGLVAGLGLPEREGVHIIGTDADAVLAWSVPLDAPGLVLPRQAGFLASLLDEAHRPGSSSGQVLRLCGSSGGLGTSTLALGLAVRAARRGLRVAAVEMDPVGGGLDVMAGAEREPGWRWGDLGAARGHVDDLTGHLPSVLGVDILAASRVAPQAAAAPVAVRPPDAGLLDPEPPGDESAAPPEATAAVLASLRRSHDLVLIDQGRVPPGHDEAVLVVGAEVRSVLAAQVALGRGLATTRAIMRTGPGRRLPADLVAESLGVRVVGVFPQDGRLPGALEAGDPPGRARGRTSSSLDRLLDRLVGDPDGRGRGRTGPLGRTARWFGQLPLGPSPRRGLGRP